MQGDGRENGRAAQTADAHNMDRINIAQPHAWENSSSETGRDRHQEANQPMLQVVDGVRQRR